MALKLPQVVLVEAPPREVAEFSGLEDSADALAQINMKTGGGYYEVKIAAGHEEMLARAAFYMCRFLDEMKVPNTKLDDRGLSSFIGATRLGSDSLDDDLYELMRLGEEAGWNHQLQTLAVVTSQPFMDGFVARQLGISVRDYRPPPEFGKCLLIDPRRAKDLL